MNPANILIAFLLAPILASAQEVKEVQILSNVAYDQIDPANQVMDIYLPVDDGSKPRPLVAMLHGGCFNSGSKQEMEAEALAMAKEGAVVLNIEYRKSPAAPYPAAWMDAMTATRAALAMAGTYNIDVNRRASYGRSAGGTIAALLALKPLFTKSWTQDSLSPQMKVAFTGHSRFDFTHRDPALPLQYRDCAEIWLNMDRSTNPARFASVSPLGMVNQWTPKLIMQYNSGDTNVLPYHSKAMTSRLMEYNRPLTLITGTGGHYLTTLQANQVRDLLKRELGLP